MKLQNFQQAIERSKALAEQKASTEQKKKESSAKLGSEDERFDAMMEVLKKTNPLVYDKIMRMD